MSVVRIAVFDARRLLRSPGAWIGTVVFAFVQSLGVALPALALESPSPAIGTAFLLGPATDIVLPILAIVLTFGAIAGERDRGRLTVFLSTPLDRAQILLGTLLGRASLVMLAVTIGSIPGILTIVALYGAPEPRPIVGFLLISILASFTYASIGVGISATFATPARSVAVLIGGFVFAYALWEPATTALHYLHTGSLPGPAPPRWFEILQMLSPLEAYSHALNGVLPPSPHLVLAITEEGIDADAGEFVGGALSAGDGGLVVAICGLWSAAAVSLGYLRLKRADVG